MRNSLLVIAFIAIICSVHAQEFAIGVDSPRPKSILEILSTNKGILIPRMNTTQRNAISPAGADRGLLIYNTSTNEFDYWNGTQWVAFPSTDSDPDWYEEGTTTVPGAITDDIYHTGNVGFGMTNSDVVLSPVHAKSQAISNVAGKFENLLGGSGVSITTNGTTGAGASAGLSIDHYTAGNAIKAGMLNTMRGSGNGSVRGIWNWFINSSTYGSAITGVLNDIDNNQNGSHIGVNNLLSGTGAGVHSGTHNQLDGTGTGVRYGTHTEISGTPSSGNANHYANYNVISSRGTGARMASYSLISGNGSGGRYGQYNHFTATGSGDITGTYNTMTGNTTGGKKGVENYINDTGNGPRVGTENVIQTTGTGLHYGTANSIFGNGSEKKYGTFNSMTAQGSGDQYGAYNWLRGMATGDKYGTYTKIEDGTPGIYYGSVIELAGTGTGVRYGVRTEMTGTPSSGNPSHYSIYNKMATAGGGERYGVYNEITATGSGTKTGVSNNFSGTMNSLKYGTYNSFGGSSNASSAGLANSFSADGSGVNYGISQSFSGSGSGNRYGITNAMAGSGDGLHFGAYHSITNTGSGDKYGVYSNVSASSGGTHYGIYSAATKTGSYAGYFLGNLSVGTNTGDNYIFPTSRGNNNQVMQTNGSGDVSWVDPSAINSTEWTDGGSYLYPSDGTSEDVSIGLNTTGPGRLNIESSKNTGVGVEVSLSSSTEVHGSNVDVTNGGTGYAIGYRSDMNSTTAKVIGMENELNASKSAVGVSNQLYVTQGASDVTNGFANYIGSATSIGTFKGLVNSLPPTAGGMYKSAYGVYNLLTINGDGSRIGMYNKLQNGSDSLQGLRNDISASGSHIVTGVHNNIDELGTTTGELYGLKNNFTIFSSMSTATIAGVYSQVLQAGNGNVFGLQSEITHNGTGTVTGNDILIDGTGTGTWIGSSIAFGTGTGGTNQTLGLNIDLSNGGNGGRYGVYINGGVTSTTGDTYGIYSNLTNIYGGTLYGIFSLVDAGSPDYAGYFLGRVSIGSFGADEYILPLVRGTANQVMQTDGSGNVGWVDPSSINDNDWDRNNGSGYLYPSTLTDNVGIGTIAATYPLTVSSTSDDRSANIYNARNGNSVFNIGVRTDMAGTISTGGGMTNIQNENTTGRALYQWSVRNVNSSPASTGSYKWGVVNDLSTTNNVQLIGTQNNLTVTGNSTNFHSGTDNNVSLTNALANSEVYGVSNSVSTTGNGTAYGIKNIALSAASGDIYGIFTSHSANGSGNQCGTYNAITSSASGSGQKIGSLNYISTLAGGNHYAVVGDAQKTGGYAGWFAGQVFISADGSDGYVMPVGDGNAGEVLITDGAGQASWNGGLNNVTVIRHEVAWNTSANTIGTSYATQPINTIEGNTTNVSLAANTITLQPGSYYIDITVPAYVRTANTTLHDMKAHLYNSSSGTVVIDGSIGSVYADNAYGYTASHIKGVVTIASATNFTVRAIASTAMYDASPPISSGWGAQVRTTMSITRVN
ncbi:MAG: hypothetical protein GY751_23410 [Bacteroidetes bacterium]|nr:hypothetical protein [Bacteroidota bacterium]